MSGCRLSWPSKYSIPGPHYRRSFLLAIVLATGAALLAALPAGAASTTIFFEGEGPEAGVTDPGACCFSFQGADFTGHEAVVAPENPALVASGEFAYRVAGTDIGLVITFEPSVDSVSFFFVHEVDEPGYGFAAASDGNQLATFESRVATTPADLANFVFAGPSEPIASIWLFGLPAYIDDFTFTPVPEPGRVLACGTALVAIFALRLLRTSTRLPRGLGNARTLRVPSSSRARAGGSAPCRPTKTG